MVASSKYQIKISKGNECTTPENGEEEKKKKSKGDSGNIQQLSTKDFHKIIIKRKEEKRSKCGPNIIAD